MSELNTDAQQYPFIPRYKRMPPNPQIGDGLVALDRVLTAALAAPSESGDGKSELIPEYRDDISLRYRLLVIQQCYFFTGSAAANLH